jgi:hypothetical protein
MSSFGGQHNSGERRIKQMIDEIRLSDILANCQAQSLVVIKAISEVRQALACRNLATN